MSRVIQVEFSKVLLTIEVAGFRTSVHRKLPLDDIFDATDRPHDYTVGDSPKLQAPSRPRMLVWAHGH